MNAAFGVIAGLVRRRWGTLLMWGGAIAALYQLALLAALVIRFEKFPNYIVWYDWPSNVARIIRSTPSIRDMGPIIADEWLIEIGFMNRDYGLGVSEWALSVVPYNLAMLFMMGVLVGMGALLSRDRACASRSVRRAGGGVTSLGAGLVLLTNATMSWVVCCATPSWVVGLAMLGVGVSTSLALEAVGVWLSAAGFGLLVLWILALASARSRTGSPLARAGSPPLQA